MKISEIENFIDKSCSSKYSKPLNNADFGTKSPLFSRSPEKSAPYQGFIYALFKGRSKIFFFTILRVVVFEATLNKDLLYKYKFRYF